MRTSGAHEPAFPQQLDELHDHLAVVQTLASVLHIAVINEQMQPTLEELHTYTLHLWNCAADCTKRLEALLEGD